MESIEVLNERLVNIYGKYLDQRPLFRLVHSEEIREIRDINPEGQNIVTSETKKYPWINNKWILEGLKETGILRNGKIEEVVDYEPMWVFEDGNGNALPPIWIAIETIMESARCAQEGKSPKYVEDDPNNPEVKAQRIKEIQESLFPNETDIGDALAYREGIVVPSNYTKGN